MFTNVSKTLTHFSFSRLYISSRFCQYRGLRSSLFRHTQKTSSDSLRMSSGLENKISALEANASELEKTLATLKAQTSGGEDKAALASKLKELLNLMIEDRNECESIRAQRDDLKEENERLRAQLSKQEYRVKHLLRTIEEIEAKQK